MATSLQELTPKITNLKCESCGHDQWDGIDEQNNRVPALPTALKQGAAHTPEQFYRIAMMVCRNCSYARMYLMTYDGA